MIRLLNSRLLITFTRFRIKITFASTQTLAIDLYIICNTNIDIIIRNTAWSYRWYICRRSVSDQGWPENFLSGESLGYNNLLTTNLFFIMLVIWQVFTLCSVTTSQFWYIVALRCLTTAWGKAVTQVATHEIQQFQKLY